MTIPTSEPLAVVAGDTLKWTRSLADYPASAGWVLAYKLVNASAVISVSSSADGDNHAVSVAAATTAAWVAGEYRWTAYVTKSAERYTVGDGSITVKPNLASAIATDTRTQAQKAIDDLLAAMATYTATNGHVQSYQIAGRQMTYRSMADIEKALRFWKKQRADEVTAERLAAGLQPKNRILVRL
jgi:hypothetical protein